MLPHEGVPRDQRRVHRQERRRTVRTSRSPEGALQRHRVREGRAHLAAHRASSVRQAVDQRQQELRAAPRVHLRAAGVHAAPERAGHRAAVRRHQPAAGAVPATSSRTTWTSRPATSITWRTVPYEQPGSHPAVPAADRGPAPGPDRHRGDGQCRWATRLRRARGGRRGAARPHARDPESDRGDQEHRARLRRRDLRAPADSRRAPRGRIARGRDVSAVLRRRSRR